MRILFVLENYLPHIGGVEVVFARLCEGLAKRGHDVTVLTRRLPGTKREERREGVRVVRVRSADSRYLFTAAAIPAALREARRADIVHTTTYNAAFPAWIAARLRGKPAVITVHETWLSRWREYSDFSAPAAALHELLERLVYHVPRFDRYICVSYATRDALRDALPSRRERIVAIRNGFDAAMWKRSRAKEAKALRARLGLEGSFVILGTGRPGTTKGFAHLVDAFPLIKERIPSAELVLVLSTDTQYRKRLAALKARAAQGVRFLPPVPRGELPVYRQMADCAVVPSTSEGFGYTVLESAASGTPVVATGTTSIPEVVWGRHVLVPPKDPQAIADAVARVFAGAYDETEEKRFSWGANVRAHEALYKELRARHAS